MVRSMKESNGNAAPSDSFSASKKLFVEICLNYGRQELEENKKYFFFGKMFRFANKTMKPADKQMMMAGMTNVIPESSMTKLMKRGLRKKYAKGCRQNCKVKTVWWESQKVTKHLNHCTWQDRDMTFGQTDCVGKEDFCYRAKDGYCQWRKQEISKDAKLITNC
ncbi:metalloproteinase inhibitor 3-like [Xenia sp. Carnegie-2017]|uniref:metalloproteinase inhibitor 3-like n=1 Tax=Xenia sp. Carnegie-2017 TaxID=2897299 RepID=UPI001F03372C|nr:metalloproteinase inhibitor 3-like [Xenia sp. Carnegie-2017]